ncbi:MAG: hypothetical protein S4CHLAM123_04110 [Chlamydiales bacterium]|nr:hypothetical protein [Chlamydiales bacterium]
MSCIRNPFRSLFHKHSIKLSKPAGYISVKSESESTTIIGWLGFPDQRSTHTYKVSFSTGKNGGAQKNLDTIRNIIDENAYYKTTFKNKNHTDESINNNEKLTELRKIANEIKENYDKKTEELNLVQRILWRVGSKKQKMTATLEAINRA